MTAWLRAHAPAADDAVHLATKPADRWFAGMMANTQLRTWPPATGSGSTFLFVDMLVEHHKGAIVMADGYSLTAATRRLHCLPAGRLPTRSGRSAS
jgi:uncharacterized protein (DUF305 family)